MPRLVLLVLLLPQWVLGLNAHNVCGSMELCLNGSDLMADRHCQCDAACPEYGDCCKDSPLFRVHDVQSAKFVCSRVLDKSSESHVFVLGSCPDDWHEPRVRQACQQPKHEDPLLSEIPITDTKTMRTYRNAYCAKCNKADTSSLRIWHAELNCHNVERRPSVQNGLIDSLAWNESLREWVISDNGTMYPCSGIIPVIPPGLEGVRHCPAEGIVKSCALGWTDTTTEKLCKSYTAYVTVRSRVYQNIHCVFCNRKNGITNKSMCKFPDIRVAFSDPPSLQLLLDFELGFKMRLGVTANCQSILQLYDPFFKKCRAILNLEIGSPSIPEEGIKLEQPLTKSVRHQHCKMVDLNSDEFALSRDNRSVWVHRYGIKYDEFVFREGGRVAVCVDESDYSLLMGVVTFTGLGISSTFLILHLCAVCLVPELRNLSGNNLASLCVALLLAYMAFLTAGLLRLDDQPLCTLAAVMMYYFFLAAFAWMLVLGFDVWRSLVRALRFQHCRGGQWRRFLAYSFFSWLTPGALVAAAVLVDNTDAVDELFRPGFGLTKCWFSREASLAIFFGAPLAIVMFLNIGFFVSAAWMTMGTRPGDSGAGVQGARRDCRLYLRLAIMVGLTWLVGLLANVCNYKLLWVAFVVLNTLQGLFIFIMFTCTAKVAKGLSTNSWAQSLRYSLSKGDKKSYGDRRPETGEEPIFDGRFK